MGDETYNEAIDTCIRCIFSLLTLYKLIKCIYLSNMVEFVFYFFTGPVLSGAPSIIYKKKFVDQTEQDVTNSSLFIIITLCTLLKDCLPYIMVETVGKKKKTAKHGEMRWTPKQ